MQLMTLFDFSFRLPCFRARRFCGDLYQGPEFEEIVSGVWRFLPLRIGFQRSTGPFWTAVLACVLRSFSVVSFLFFYQDGLEIWNSFSSVVSKSTVCTGFVRGALGFIILVEWPDEKLGRWLCKRFGARVGSVVYVHAHDYRIALHIETTGETESRWRWHIVRLPKPPWLLLFWNEWLGHVKRYIAINLLLAKAR